MQSFLAIKLLIRPTSEKKHQYIISAVPADVYYRILVHHVKLVLLVTIHPHQPSSGLYAAEDVVAALVTNNRAANEQ